MAMPIIHLKFSEPSHQRLEALRVKIAADGYGEVIKNALRLYEALIERDEAGRKLFEQTDGNYVEWSPFQP
jgi:hypothetical protein